MVDMIEMEIPKTKLILENNLSGSDFQRTKRKQ
jgi:hypothetical protein